LEILYKQNNFVYLQQGIFFLTFLTIKEAFCLSC